MPIPVGIPFQFIRHEVVVEVRINGQGPYSMLLDTGTAPSVIDIHLARKIGLEVNSKGEKGDAGGNDRNLAFEADLPRVDLGGFSATNIHSLAMDLSQLSSKFGRSIQGVLGDSLFSGRVIQFDYPHRIARFLNGSSVLKRGSKSITVRFKHENSEVHFQGLKVNGKPVLANLDSGSNSSFSFTSRAIARLGLDRDVAKGTSNTATSFNGSYKSQIGTIGLVQLGPFRLKHPKAQFWPSGSGHDGSPWDVNVGNAFLEDYIVTVDYRKGLLTFQRP